MHIAFWSPAWPLSKFQNGVITYVHWMKHELERQGHRISVFTAEADEAAHEPGLYVVRPVRHPRGRRIVRRFARLWRPIENDVFGFAAEIAAEILKVHKRDAIDIIEMEETFGWFADVSKLTSLPVLVKLHGPGFLTLTADQRETRFGRERIVREGKALRHAPAIVSPSAFTLKQTMNRYKLSPQATQHIVNPLTMDSDTPIWNLNTCNQGTILFVGRFDVSKGADIALKAFLLLLKHRPELKLIFVGPDTGVPSAGGQPIHFARYCEDLYPRELRDRVDFRGRMSNSAIAKLRAQAMVTLVSSRWENAPYTLLEAMYQACPVVSTDAGGCPEILAHGVTGRLAESENPDDFATQLSAILQDPKAAELMGKAARRLVVERHSPARVASATVEMYEKAMADRSEIL